MNKIISFEENRGKYMLAIRFKAIFGISHGTFGNWRRNGKLKTIKLEESCNRSLYVNLESLQNLPLSYKERVYQFFYQNNQIDFFNEYFYHSFKKKSIS